MNDDFVYRWRGPIRGAILAVSVAVMFGIGWMIGAGIEWLTDVVLGAMP